MVEPGEGWGAIEPFLYLNKQLVTWNEARADPGARGRLSADSERDLDAQGIQAGVKMKVSAFAAGQPGQLVGLAALSDQQRFAEPLKGRLFLALRPFRVNPPWQELGMGGGAISVQELAYADRTVVIDRDKRVIALSRPEAFGAARFEDGSITDYLSSGTLPAQSIVFDKFGYASGALEFDLDLAAGQQRDVFLVVPLFKESPPAPAEATDAGRRPPVDRGVRCDRQGLASHARPGVDRYPGRPEDRRGAQDDARLHPDQRRRSGAAAGTARLPAQLDPRRRADLGGAVAHGPSRGGAQVHRMVRALPVQGRRHPLLRRRARRRSGGRARQPRRMALPARRILPLLARRRPADRNVAEHRRRGRLHR